MDMPDYCAIGKRIKERRHALKMTQEKLAEAAGVGTQHMSKIENGSTKLSLPCIISIANALETTVDFLLMDCVNASRPDVIREAESTIFMDCSPEEIFVITQTVIALKRSLRKSGLSGKE